MCLLEYLPDLRDQPQWTVEIIKAKSDQINFLVGELKLVLYFCHLLRQEHSQSQ